MSDTNSISVVNSEDVTKALVNLATRVAQLEEETPLGGELGILLSKQLHNELNVYFF